MTYTGESRNAEPHLDNPSAAIGRRAFVGGFLSVTALAGCTCVPPKGNEQPQLSLPAIDVHCHVFNTTDIPATALLEKVIIPQLRSQPENDDLKDKEDYWVTLARMLAAIVLPAAPTARQELERLRLNPFALLTVSSGLSEQEKRERVTAGLKAAQDYIRNLGNKRKDDEITPIKRDQKDLNQKDFDALEPDALRNLVGETLSRDDFVGRHIRWVLLLLSTRSCLLEHLVALYGGPKQARLFTPSFLDFDYWLVDPQEDQPSRSTLNDQIALMEHIQRRQARKGGPYVHGLVPYDPLRGIVERGALERVKDAILHRGFLGVKLYPPMGFQPINNQGLVVKEGPAVFRDYVKRHAGGSAEVLAEQLDATLCELYGWCCEEDVPIMAHATDSMGAGEMYSQRAHPQFWAEVVAPGNFPGLRLNLSHFGDFEEITKKRRIASRRAPPKKRAWDDIASELFAPDKNVYVDVSYLHEFLAADGSAVKDKIRQNLRRIFNANPSAPRRVMYGSDWSMLGRERRHEDFMSLMRDEFGTLKSLGLLPRATEDRFFTRNAWCYLGLEPGDGNRRRLEAYYKEHGLDSSWMCAFDGAGCRH